MPKTTKPAVNPALQATFAGKDAYLLKTLKMGLFCAAPAILEDYDRKNMRATIRPAVMAKKSNGESLAQDFIYDVPVRFCGGGGYAVNLPLQKGDAGWLIFCDRDIANFKNARAVVPSNTNRMHAQEDPFFLPDAMQTVNIAGEDQGRAVFQTLDGSNKISIGTSDVKVDTQKLTINAAQEVVINTPNMTVTGNLTVEQIIKSLKEVIVMTASAVSVSLSKHLHGGVLTGSSFTTGPNDPTEGGF